MYNFVRSYADSSSASGEPFGTITVSIPRARGFRIDRKGRKRRFTDKYEIKLRNGAGMNRRALVSKLNKELKPNLKDSNPTPKFVQKLIALMRGKY